MCANNIIYEIYKIIFTMRTNIISNILLSKNVLELLSLFSVFNVVRILLIENPSCLC